MALLVTACTDTGPETTSRLAINLSPLTLPGVAEVCYDLEVKTAQGTVWSRDGVCSSRYGAGGGVTYVGPCDADEPLHTVHVRFAGVFADSNGNGSYDVGTDQPMAFVDPCAPPHTSEGCTQPATCSPNADTRVDFDLTVMRPANQGFFDIAVNFDDVFCSAKVDCTYPASGGNPERPIQMVFHPETGERIDSVVVAWACTDGGNDQLTALYSDDLVVTCDGVEYAYSPSAGLGNIEIDDSDLDGDFDDEGPIVRYMIFAGQEDLVDQGTGFSADKRYWNVALGLSNSFLAGRDCTLTTRAVAASGELANGATPDGAVYPFIDIEVPLTVDGERVCSQHALGGDEVRVRYTHTADHPRGLQLCNQFVTTTKVDGLGQIVDCGGGCADGTREHLVDPGEYPSIAGCEGTWQSSVDQAQHLCSEGWHVCNGTEPQLRALTYAQAIALGGCFAFDAFQDNGSCGSGCINGDKAFVQTYANIDMAAIGGDCLRKYPGAVGCLSGARIDAATHEGLGCDYRAGFTTGVVCCAD